jgi:hypothetical protein
MCPMSLAHPHKRLKMHVNSNRRLAKSETKNPNVNDEQSKNKKYKGCVKGHFELLNFSGKDERSLGNFFFPF